MKLPNLSLTILAGIGLVAAAAVAVAGHAVPTELWTIDLVLVGAVAGVSVPTVTASPVATVVAAQTAPAAAPVPVPAVPGPLPPVVPATSS